MKWTTYSGKKLALKDMELAHLLNALDLVKRRLARLEPEISSLLAERKETTHHAWLFAIASALEIAQKDYQNNSKVRNAMERELKARGELSYGNSVYAERKRYALKRAWAWKFRIDQISADIIMKNLAKVYMIKDA